MNKKIYKCSICGNVTELLYDGGGELVCCGQPMELMEEKVQEEGNEKHLPVIEEIETGYKVKVGSVEHPMEDKHYIEWIELIVDGVSSRVFLQPGEKPEAEFKVAKGESVSAREYCNIHGLWKAEK
ncbi:MAG TPA: desulfoferrodoxin [Candidatus Moranbacteria bacterium]|nr:desulfoferrodoxin [Candidatus Moranbacteria bacterium]